MYESCFVKVRCEFPQTPETCHPNIKTLLKIPFSFLFLLFPPPLLPDDQGEWATATKKKKQPAQQHPRGGGGPGYGNGPGGFANGGRGMDDRRGGGRGGIADKMRGVR